MVYNIVQVWDGVKKALIKPEKKAPCAYSGEHYSRKVEPKRSCLHAF